MSVRLVHTRTELADALADVARVGFVPTMGALHEGHASLMAAARGISDVVVASIFVNPTQFAPGEDLAKYPRTLESDLALCAANGVDIAFAPSVAEVYPGGDPAVSINPGPLAGVLEGAVRPTHFAGVLTVVAKLFGLVRPDVAVFGQKDYQQLTLIRQMVSDLCMGVEIVGAPTIREADGLAMSSRNRFLSAVDRANAVALSQALMAGRAVGSRGAEAVLQAARDVLAGFPDVRVDYLELTSPSLAAPAATGEARLLVAARVGSTRLIDNMRVDLGQALA